MVLVRLLREMQEDKRRLLCPSGAFAPPRQDHRRPRELVRPKKHIPPLPLVTLEVQSNRIKWMASRRAKGCRKPGSQSEPKGKEVAPKAEAPFRLSAVSNSGSTQ